MSDDEPDFSELNEPEPRCLLCGGPVDFWGGCARDCVRNQEEGE